MAHRISHLVVLAFLLSAHASGSPELARTQRLANTGGIFYLIGAPIGYVATTLTIASAFWDSGVVGQLSLSTRQEWSSPSRVCAVQHDFCRRTKHCGRQPTVVPGNTWVG